MKKKESINFKEAEEFVPIHFQFISGIIHDKEQEREFYENRVSVQSYQVSKCLNYAHYKPITKIIYGVKS